MILNNNAGARTHPCFTPLLPGKSADASPSSRTRAIIVELSDNGEALTTDCVEGLGEVNKGGVEVLMLLLALFLELSSSEIMSTVPRPALKPHWLSGRRPISRCLMRLLRRTLGRIFPAIDSREIPRWLSQDCRLPLLWTMEASLNA
ncbi:hypothetical protein OS493_009951 [Desmophyllum pertusum]|uniref:Uncharacterized protein n=1 Tax=Desmophyllum pertusum TaxID=174260 RepID=A0A9X0CG04_9CNID|nr:hypothetical protein OS493_009951 [Desmophyllum pertusum]